VPPARSEGLLVERVGEETVIYDLASKEAHALKPLAGLVFTLADGAATQAELAKLATTQLNQSVTEGDIADAVEQLTDRSLLDVPLSVRDGLSSRQLVHRSAFAGAAAFAAPLITSIVAPTAAMAQSGIPSGCTGCGKNKDCLSGHCCQVVSGKSCNFACCVLSDNSCHITATNDCTVQLASGACGTLVCPPGTAKCCS
jgi:hypothetical protein